MNPEPPNFECSLSRIDDSLASIAESAKRFPTFPDVSMIYLTSPHGVEPHHIKGVAQFINSGFVHVRNEQSVIIIPRQQIVSIKINLPKPEE